MSERQTGTMAYFLSGSGVQVFKRIGDSDYLPFTLNSIGHPGTHAFTEVPMNRCVAPRRNRYSVVVMNVETNQSKEGPHHCSTWRRGRRIEAPPSIYR